jgi:hypothetical protein
MRTKLNGAIQILFILTEAYFIRELYFLLTRFLVVIKRVCTGPVDFVRHRKLGKSPEKQFETISNHEKEGEGFW